MEAEPYRDSIYIAAAPEAVFDYFIRAELLVRWMGDDALLEPRPGGLFRLVIGPRTVEGRYVRVDRPHRVVISWGRRGSRQLPPGKSVLEVTLAAEAGGTRVTVVHSGLPGSERPRHALGWRYYLDRLQLAAEGRHPSLHVVPSTLTEGAD